MRTCLGAHPKRRSEAKVGKTFPKTRRKRLSETCSAFRSYIVSFLYSWRRVSRRKPWWRQLLVQCCFFAISHLASDSDSPRHIESKSHADEDMEKLSDSRRSSLLNKFEVKADTLSTFANQLTDCDSLTLFIFWQEACECFRSEQSEKDYFCMFTESAFCISRAAW